MSNKLVVFLGLILWSITTLPLPKEVSAEIPLTKAVVQNIRNLVRLIPQSQTARPARVSDAMNPGDAIATGRESLAELNFNDGSLARVGAQAVFQFLPNSRAFRLSNGTLLLLIPPGRGSTRVQTPNARAGIRGSALFVRYNPDNNITVVGALTDSNIEVFNQDGSQQQVLRAGQLAVMNQDRIQGIYDFDLRTFYETSDLVKGLNLTQLGDKTSGNTAIAEVQAETSSAVTAQTPISGTDVIENPNFVQLSASWSDLPSVINEPNNSSPRSGSDRDFGLSNIPNPLDTNSSLQNLPLDGGEILSNQQNSPINLPPSSIENGLPASPTNPNNTPAVTPTTPDNIGTNTPAVTPVTPDNTPAVTPATPDNIGTNTPAVTPVTPDNTPAVTPATPDNTPAVTPATPDNIGTNTPAVTPVTPDNTPAVTPTTPDNIGTNTPAVTPVTPNNTPAVTPVTPNNTPAVTPATPDNTPAVTPTTPNNTPAVTPTTPNNTPAVTPTTPNNTPAVTPATPDNSSNNNNSDGPGNSRNGPPGTVGNPNQSDNNDRDRSDGPGNSRNGPPGTVGNPNQSDNNRSGRD